MSRRVATERAAFTLIEVLVAAAIAAAVITTAVMIFQNLTSGGPRSSYGRVTVGAALPAFYGGEATAVDAYFAPNYGRAAHAEMLRDQFLEDVQRASAVYCLGREVVNTVHPATIPVAGGFFGGNYDMPDAFRGLLATTYPASAAIFTAYRGVSTATHASIFVLVPAEAPRDATDDEPAVPPTLAVLAVYDIDLTPTVSPAGTYASVKRYQGGALTDYYDVFYPASIATIPFKPLVVCFERAGRAALVEGDAIDRFKQAAERPFYFIWWPDPAAPSLEALADPGGDYGAGDPRSAYAAMGGRTAFFFVVPMFPSL